MTYLNQINIWQFLTVMVLVSFPSMYFIKSWYLKSNGIKYLGTWKHIGIQAATRWVGARTPRHSYTEDKGESPHCLCICSTDLSNKSKIKRDCRSTHTTQFSVGFAEKKQSAGKLLAHINSCFATHFARCHAAAVILPLLCCWLGAEFMSAVLLSYLHCKKLAKNAS